MNVKSEARRDAETYARAQMFYGEGAGTQRKLIQASVTAKEKRSPEYAAEFRRAYAKQDMAYHALKAQKDRKRIDRSESASRNIRAIARGDSRGVNASLLVVGGIAYVLHRTGYDKIIIDKVSYKIRTIRNRRAAKKTVDGWLRVVDDK